MTVNIVGGSLGEEQEDILPFLYITDLPFGFFAMYYIPSGIDFIGIDVIGMGSAGHFLISETF